MYAVKATPTAAMVTIKIGTIESVAPDEVSIGLLVAVKGVVRFPGTRIQYSHWKLCHHLEHNKCTYCCSHSTTL